MANVFLFSDNARSTLASGFGPSATSITLAPGGGALFPSPGAGQQFALSLNDASTHLSYEIVYCTHRSGDVLTVVRAQEGTSALTWLTGDLCWNGPTSGQMAGMVQIPHMTDASIAPVFATTGVVGNFGVTGTSQVNGVSYFGASLDFYANPAYPGGPLLAFAVGDYLWFNSAFGFELVTTGGILLTAPGAVATSAALVVATTITSGDGIQADSGDVTAAAGKLRAGTGAYLSGDPNCATLLADFLSASAGGNGEYFYVRLANGEIIQGYVGVNSTGADAITFPNAFPNYCSQVLVCEGAPGGWVSGEAPTIFGAQDIGPANFELYVTKWSGASWGLTGGITYRYIAIGG